MRLKGKLFLTTVFATLLGVGVFGGVKLSENKSAVKVEAATTSGIEIRFTRPSDWGNNTVCIHTWDEGGSGTTWPGYAMTYLWDNEYGQAVWSWTPTSGSPLYSKIIFNNNNHGMETSTLNSPSTSKHYYYDNGWQSMDCATMKLYLYDYDGSYDSSKPYAHIWREDASLTFSTWPGIKMSSTSLSGNGRVYEITVSNAVNRIIFSKNGSEQTADLTPTGGNYCYVIGDLDGSNTWWDNINYVHAHNFNQNILNFKSTPSSDQRDTGYCKSHYSLAKSTFLLIQNNQYVLEQLQDYFPDALPRLEAWARANGESFNTTSMTFSRSSGLTALIRKENGSTSVVVLAASLATISAIGGYFFLRRKKQK